MTGKDDFTAVEWAILTELPIRVIAAAINVQNDSSMAVMLEQIAGLTQLSQGAMERPGSQLVQDVFDQYKAEGEGEARVLELSENYVEQLVPDTILRATQASEILAAKANQRDQLAYSSWLIETAEAVVTAAKSGGKILGIGGQLISDEEQEFLDGLTAAFARSEE